MRKLIPYLSVLAALAVLGGCASMNRTQKGAVIGGATGAAVGAAVSKNDTKGAILGGAIGAVAGGIIGNYLDKQAQEMEQVEGATVTREGDELKVAFENKILFDVDKSELKSASQDQLVTVAGILNKYPDTNIIVMGHTDNTGSDEYNQRLSERRARAVEGFLETKGVASGRITSKGYGETMPVADNATEAGRAENRRVELSIKVTQEFIDRANEQQG
jgi:outer membrane protein OmpA-like peptidoglycan-associated protein